MTRVIAGDLGGRTLQAPPGRDTRPTSDRVREALFARLDHEGWLDGTRVLDLYAGSGALGIEAASRGAAHVLLVESAPPAVRAVRANLAALDVGAAALRADRVERVLALPPDAPYDLVLADPPYPVDEPELAAVLGALVAHGWLAPDALVVVERAHRSPEPAWPDGLAPDGDRRYGETRLWFARTAPAPDGGVGSPP